MRDCRCGENWVRMDEGRGKRVEGKIRTLKQVSQDCYANTRQTTLAIGVKTLADLLVLFFFFAWDRCRFSTAGEQTGMLPRNNPSFSPLYSLGQRSYHGLRRRPLLSHRRRRGHWRCQRPGGGRLLLQRADGGEPGQRGGPLLRAVSIVRDSRIIPQKEQI